MTDHEAVVWYAACIPAVARAEGARTGRPPLGGNAPELGAGRWQRSRAAGVLGVLAFATFAAPTDARGLATFSLHAPRGYAPLAVMGLIAAASLNTAFDLIPIYGHAVWLRAPTAAGHVGSVGLSADRGPAPGAPERPRVGEEARGRLTRDSQKALP